MPSIGYGSLPDPAGIDPQVTDGWFVPSPSGQIPDKYFKLIGQQWYLQQHRIHTEADPVHIGGSSVIRVEDLKDADAGTF